MNCPGSKIFAIAAMIFALNCQFVSAQQCHCHTCENPLSQRTTERRQYWQNLHNDLLSRSSGRMNRSGATQVVFLDFDTGDDGDIDYSAAMREAIQTQLESIYARFDVSFTQTIPGGDFSTLFFNEGFPGGLAQDIDFRNLDRNDTAVINADVGLAAQDIVPFSAFVAAHELGHLLGLRHADMFGPIGDGIISGFSSFYVPEYPGPTNGFSEAVDHIMATGTFGIPFSSFVTPSWFSERSAIKVRFAEAGFTTLDVEDNDSIASAQILPLQPLRVPNTIVSGMNAAEQDFTVSAAVVEGSLNFDGDQQDVFQVSGSEGDLFNIQVLSAIPDRLAVDPIDPNVSVFDSQGEFVDYYGTDAFNESELKSTDCNMIDLMLPADGTYFIEVDSLSSDSGVYEVFVYRFNGVIGDVNCDGQTNLLDVAPFVDLIISGEFSPKADTNFDGQVNLLDVNPFVVLISGS